MAEWNDENFNWLPKYLNYSLFSWKQIIIVSILIAFLLIELHYYKIFQIKPNNFIYLLLNNKIIKR